MLHFLGRAYPSSPGLMLMLGMTFLQLRHCREILVAFDLMPEAETTMPGILTRRETFQTKSKKNKVNKKIRAIKLN